MVRGRGRGEDRGQPGEAELGQVRQPEEERERDQRHQQQRVGQVNHVTLHWAWSLKTKTGHSSLDPVSVYKIHGS